MEMACANHTIRAACYPFGEHGFRCRNPTAEQGNTLLCRATLPVPCYWKMWPAPGLDRAARENVEYPTDCKTFASDIPLFTSRPDMIFESLNRPGFDAAIFFEKDSDYAQAVSARSP
jgi:hypothetical protein